MFIKYFKLFNIFLILVLLINTKCTKLIYFYNNQLSIIDYYLANSHCKYLKTFNKCLNNNNCSKCHCYYNNNIKNPLYYINLNNNQIKKSILINITKITTSIYYEIFNSYFFRFFLEIFITLLYDTFIYKLIKYPLLLISIKLIC